MMPEIPQEALEIGYWFFFVALPLVLFFGLRMVRLGSRLARLAAVVLIPWIAVQQYHLALVQPQVFKVARAKGELMYDGTGASAAVAIIGFVFPVLVILPALGAELLNPARPLSAEPGDTPSVTCLLTPHLRGCSGWMAVRGSRCEMGSPKNQQARMWNRIRNGGR